MIRRMGFRRQNFDCLSRKKLSRRSNLALFFALFIILILSREKCENKSELEKDVVEKDQNDVSEMTFVISCGNEAALEMQSLLKSLLSFSSVPIRMIFITDPPGLYHIENIFKFQLSSYHKPLNVDVYILDESKVEKWAAPLKYNPRCHHSRAWGTAKLMVPWLFPHLDKAIILDTDMILLQDPSLLWSYFSQNSESNWTYSMPIFDSSDPARMCSCVVLMNCARARSLDVYPYRISKALESQPFKKWWRKDQQLWSPKFGDQAVYWALMRAFPGMLRTLPRNWDIDRCHHFLGEFQDNSTGPVSLLHRNCDFFSKKNESDDYEKAKIFFDFFDNYRWNWLNSSTGIHFPVRFRKIDGSEVFDVHY